MSHCMDPGIQWLPHGKYIVHHRRSAVCMDGYPETVRGEAADTNGALFYHMEATCNGLECPPYDPQKELTCVVCTK